MMKKQIELAPGWSIPRVAGALKRSDKKALVSFIRKRYEDRFFEQLEWLDKNGPGAGFCIMAICCLLVETFQAYRTGLPSSNKRELERLLKTNGVPAAYLYEKNEIPADNGEPFRCFFTTSQAFFPDVNGGEFYQDIRNGLLHQSQTKKGWRVRVGEKVLWSSHGGVKVIDRKKFAAQLHLYFEDFLAQLQKSGMTDLIWRRVNRKLWWLILVSKP